MNYHNLYMNSTKKPTVGDTVKYFNSSSNPFKMTVVETGGDGVVQCVIGTSDIKAGAYRTEDLRLIKSKA